MTITGGAQLATTAGLWNGGVRVPSSSTLCLVKGDWKYVSPSNAGAYHRLTGIETGNSPAPQLYNLKEDIGEKNNLAEKYPDKIKELKELLEKIKSKNDETFCLTI